MVASILKGVSNEFNVHQQVKVIQDEPLNILLLFQP